MLSIEQILPLSAQLLVSESTGEEMVDLKPWPKWPPRGALCWQVSFDLHQSLCFPPAFLRTHLQKEFEDFATHFAWDLSDPVYLSGLTPRPFLVLIAIYELRSFPAICGSKLTEEIMFLPWQIPAVPRLSLTPGFWAHNNEKKQDFTAWRTGGNYPSTNNTFLQDFPAWADWNYMTSMENTVAA